MKVYKKFFSESCTHNTEPLIDSNKATVQLVVKSEFFPRKKFVNMDEFPFVTKKQCIENFVI